MQLQLIVNFPILRLPTMTVDPNRRAREKTSPIGDRHFSHTCAPWVTDNSRLSGPADKTSSPPCARPSRPSPISQSSLLARYTTCTHTWRRVARLGGGRRGSSLSGALMHARSICWYNTDVSCIALRYVSLAFRIARGGDLLMTVLQIDTS